MLKAYESVKEKEKLCLKKKKNLHVFIVVFHRLRKTTGFFQDDCRKHIREEEKGHRQRKNLMFFRDDRKRVKGRQLQGRMNKG